MATLDQDDLNAIAALLADAANKQTIRDALKLAPSVGDPAAGSVDALIGGVQATAGDTNEVLHNHLTEDDGLGTLRFTAAALTHAGAAVLASNNSASVPGTLGRQFADTYERADRVYSAVTRVMNTIFFTTINWDFGAAGNTIGVTFTGTVNPNCKLWLMVRHWATDAQENIGYIAPGGTWVPEPILPANSGSKILVFSVEAEGHSTGITPGIVTITFGGGEAGDFYEPEPLTWVLPSSVGGAALWALLDGTVTKVRRKPSAKEATTAKEATVLGQFGVTYGITYPIVRRDGVINLTRGDVAAVNFTLNASFPLTGKKVYFCAQKRKAETNATAIVNRACTITDVATRACSITLTAEELATAGTYLYEIEVRNTDESAPATAEAGTLNIIEDLRK